MDVEKLNSENFILEIRSDSKVAVAVLEDGEEHIYLPEKSNSTGTYYQDTSDSLVKTENGYRLQLSSEPEKYSLIN